MEFTCKKIEFGMDVVTILPTDGVTEEPFLPISCSCSSRGMAITGMSLGTRPGCNKRDFFDGSVTSFLDFSRLVIVTVGFGWLEDNCW
jgi:hypothetical protein